MRTLCTKSLKGKQAGFITALLVIAAVIYAGLAAQAAVSYAPTHLDHSKNPKGCIGCHMRGQSPGSKFSYERCFKCHGSVKKGVKGEARTDIESLFNKNSKHPVLSTTIYHSANEEFPERNPNVPRHVTCVDCHSPHLSTPDKPWGGTGYSPGRIRVDNAAEEYELCYKCHSDSANLPAGEEDLIDSFNPSNPSYHPIEMAGRNKNVPSLINRLMLDQRITCDDCHGNSDPYGPKGPHGSDYAPLLVAQYRTDDGPEGAQTYALCYKCHSRQSILNDESFQRHKFHIVYQNTSCYTCHASHGSRENPSLISFNRTVVTNGSDGGPRYAPLQPGRPYCYLSCHGANHSYSGINGKKWPW